MKKLTVLFCLFLYLLIPLSPALAVNSTASKKSTTKEQISSEELAPNKLTLKEKILLKRLTKKSKKNRNTADGDDGYAIASMVLGVLSLISGLGIFLAIPAIILAAVAFKRMRRNGETQNRGLAIAGLVMGLSVCVLTVGVIGLFLLL